MVQNSTLRECGVGVGRVLRVPQAAESKGQQSWWQNKYKI